MRFPDGFLWGVATSSYQVEGAIDADGKGESIWDRFAHDRLAENGDVACDHYRRWRDDVALLAELGVNAYRFSIAWPRLFPDGRSREARGFEHYGRLIDTLVERGIEPVPTLYHWELPQALEDEGGWRSRETVERFAEFAAACFEAYGGRVRRWITINEPWIVGLLGYLHGLHAPGYKDDVLGEVTTFHHLLLAHGRAVAELRRAGDGEIGITLSRAPHYRASDDPADIEVTAASDEYVNRWFLDAVLRGTYPERMRRRYEELVGPLEFVRDGDLETIATPSDFLGVNYYARRVMRHVPGRTPYPWEVVVPDHTPKTDGGTEGVPMTEAGTEITPEAFFDLLVGLRRDYGDAPILITENGAVFGDGPDGDGRVRDDRRVRFVHDHLGALHRAIEAGVPVRGYFHWSFMDNFEWALGYAQRFGLVHVDYGTQARTVKDSGRYYARIARANELVAP